MALVIGGLALIGSSLAWSAQGFIHEAKGDVKAAAGKALSQSVKKDDLIADDTTITVGPKASATLRFEDGTVILLNENSSFLVQKYAYDEKNPSAMSALFSMLRGGMRAVTGLIASKKPEAVRVTTPAGTIGIRGTEYMAQLTYPKTAQLTQMAQTGPTPQLYMQVISGRVALQNVGGTGIFSAGQSVFVPTPTTIARTIPAVPAGTFGAMPQAKLPPPVPVKAPAPPAAKPDAKKGASLEEVKAALKEPGDVAKKVADLADKGVSASVIIAALGEVSSKDIIAAIAALIAKGADPAAVVTAAIAAGADPAAVTSAAVSAAPGAAAAIVSAAVKAGANTAAVTTAAIGAGADPTVVTSAAAAGAQPQAPATPARATPSGTPVPGGGGSGTPVSPS